MATSPARKIAATPKAASMKRSSSKSRIARKAMGKSVSGRSVRSVQRRKILAISSFSIAKVAFLFFVTIVLVFLIAGIVIWNFAGASGLVLKLNHFVDQLIGSTSYHVTGTSLLAVFAGIGIVWSIIATIVTFVGAMLFNLAAEYIGGISVVVGLDDTNL